MTTTPIEPLFRAVKFCDDYNRLAPVNEGFKLAKDFITDTEFRAAIAALRQPPSSQHSELAIDLVERWQSEWLVGPKEHWGDKIEWQTARTIAKRLDALRQPPSDAMTVEIERLREAVTELWHESTSSDPLHYHLGMTIDEYAAWVNPAALTQGKPDAD
jgi:hypothetical protein